MKKTQIDHDPVGTIRKNRMDQIIEAIAQDPNQIGIGYSDSFVFIVEPGGNRSSHMKMSYVKRNHPEIYETLQAHLALRKLKKQWRVSYVR